METVSKPLIAIAAAVAVLAAVACAAGLAPAFGGTAAAPTFTSLRGETVVLQGKGLYRNDSVSMAAQAVAQDLVTLAFGVPLLLLALFFARRGSLRAGLLLSGTFAYFAYTYATYAFGVVYNELFLAYVALLSLAVAGLILSLGRLDARLVKERFSRPAVRRVAVGFDFFVGGALLLMWLARILSGPFGGADATAIEHYTTLPIQVMDLAFVVPLALVAGATLAADQALGYLLTGLFLLKGLTLGLALLAMIIRMAAAGVAGSPAETAVFCVIVALCVVVAALYVASIKEA